MAAPTTTSNPQCHAPMARTSNEVANILVAARKLIEKPENWGSHQYDHRGRFCAVGALMAAQNKERKDYSSIEEIPGFVLLNEVTPGGPIEFNDTHTHAEVLAAFDRAIALARAAETEAHGNADMQAPAVKP